MSSKTTNYNLHKIDLTDAPPDITVLNPNWDTIDRELKARLPLDGSVPMSGTSLGLNNGTAIVGANQTRVVLNTLNAQGNNQSYRGLAVFNSTDSPDIAQAACFTVDNGSGEVIYKLFGDHNINLLRQQLSAVTTATVG